MATLQELKTQITNANALGKAKIVGKGGTVADNADTVAIMNAIDSIPAGGGGSVPTVVNEITWDGDITQIEDKVEVDVGGGIIITLYRVSSNVLPYSFTIDTNDDWSSVYTYSAKGSDGSAADFASQEISTNYIFNMSEGINLIACCTYHDNVAPYSAMPNLTLPKSGTWFSMVSGFDEYFSSFAVTKSNNV